MSIWSSVVTPGVVAAGVTVTFNWWILRPRADLRLVPGVQTVEDAERIQRANDGSSNWSNHPHWQPRFFVRLTNHGDAAAHGIDLFASHDCSPYIWIGDAPKLELNQPPTAGQPMWSSNVGALEPNESVTVMVMCGAGPKQKIPTLTVSWPRLPGRRFAGRNRRHIYLGTAPTVETGWPGGHGW